MYQKIPSSFEDFQNYQLYDSLSFMTSGTIAFNIGVKLGPAGLGSSTFAEGDWVTTVEKTSPVHVSASYRVHKLKVSQGLGVSRPLFHFQK